MMVQIGAVGSVCPAARVTMTFPQSWLCDGCRAASNRQDTASETKSHGNSGYLLGKRLVAYCALQKILVKLRKTAHDSHEFAKLFMYVTVSVIRGRWQGQ